MKRSFHILFVLTVNICTILSQRERKISGADNSDSIVFMDNLKSEDVFPNDTIPLEFARRLNEVTDINDFLREFVDDSEISIASRFSPTEQRRGNGNAIPKVAACMPELTTVPLQVENPDLSYFYYPSCTRIERCGGCCGHTLLACEPTETETINYEIIGTKLAGNSKLSKKSTNIVSVVKHKKCGCVCKTKEEQCGPNQEYLKNKCICACRNKDEESKCKASNQRWDPNTCKCEAQPKRRFISVDNVDSSYEKHEITNRWKYKIYPASRPSPTTSKYDYDD